ncbi:MAG TPA: response regulator, partial [Elusimicrobiota bacterium]|nr:response regulator [Elusimicrobiota bacterium]
MSEKKKILIVDDDSRITDLLSDFCGDHGYEVKTLNDSRQVVSTAMAWRPDLITLDLEMPERTGLEVLQEIRGKLQENQTLLDSETNLVIKAAAEKRQALLHQDLANMERRIAIESREHALRSRQKTEPLAVLKTFLVSLKGDEAAIQNRA